MQIKHKYKDVIITVFITIIFWVIVVINYYWIEDYLGTRFEPTFIVMIGMLVAGTMYLNTYLSETYKDFIENNNDNELIKLKERLDNLSDEMSNSNLNIEQEKKIIDLLKERILSDTSIDIYNELKQNISTSIDLEIKSRISNNFNKMTERLQREIYTLEKRAKVNLIIGSITAIIGIFSFVYFIMQNITSSQKDYDFLIEFLPRLSLVLVIEIFAYFFLNLYKSSLSEIKYFHNELTNIEYRFIAMEETVLNNDKTTLKIIIREFLKIERNFLLKKGQSTVYLEDRKNTINEHKNIVETLTKIIKKQEA